VPFVHGELVDAVGAVANHDGAVGVVRRRVREEANVRRTNPAAPGIEGAFPVPLTTEAHRGGRLRSVDLGPSACRE